MVPYTYPCHAHIIVASQTAKNTQDSANTAASISCLSVQVVERTCKHLLLILRLIEAQSVCAQKGS